MTNMITKEQENNDISIKLHEFFDVYFIYINDKNDQNLNKLKDNPYVKTTIREFYDDTHRDNPSLLVFDKISNNRAIFKRLNTLGSSWNIFYDMSEGSEYDKDGGYSSIITNNNVPDSGNKTRTTNQKDRIISIDSYQGVVSQEVKVILQNTDNKIINIWYAKGENSILSNFAAREFTYDNRVYKSVEHAYQTLKSGEFNEEAYNRPFDFVGTKRNAPKNTNIAISSSLMKSLMRASFEQNAEAKQKLLDTGNAALTHKGGSDIFWEKEFPKLLTEIRQELSNNAEKAKIKTKSGYSDLGKGTAEGDSKDKAMRDLAKSVIVELVSLKPSSSLTSFKVIDPFSEPKIGTNSFIGGTNKILMLARNGELKNKPLNIETKQKIKEAYDKGYEFVVGDMPGVDTQFIEYLLDIGAEFTNYHARENSRINIIKTPNQKEDNFDCKTKK